MSTSVSGEKGVRLELAAAAASAGGRNDDDEARRFEVELEFVQCLASPSYLNCMWLAISDLHCWTKSEKKGGD